MRVYMAVQERNWLKSGGALDAKDTELYNELVSIETVPRPDGKIQLEAKKDAKRRGMPSPNRYDALGLSLAAPVVHKQQDDGVARRADAKGAGNADWRAYDPHADILGS